MAWEVVVAVCADWADGEREVRGRGYYYEHSNKVTDTLDALAERTMAALGGAPPPAQLREAIALFERAEAT